MLKRRALWMLILASMAGTADARDRAKAWDAFDGGLLIQIKGDTFHTTLGKKALQSMVARIAELKPFYEKHFGTRLKKGWRFVVLADMAQYNKYATDVTKARRNVQGQCLYDKRMVVVCDSKRYGWLTTLSHEYAHAYYETSGPIWLREGVASLVEVARRKGKKMEIPVNPPRLRGLRVYQGRKHYLSIDHLLRGKKEPDGYGYSYEHGWSVHFFLYSRDAKKYRSFLAAVRKKTERDLSAHVEKAFGLDLKTLNERWKVFVDGLKEDKGS